MQLIINAESPEVMTLHPIWTLAMEKRAGFSLWGFKGDRPEVRETDLKTQVVPYPWTRGNCVPSDRIDRASSRLRDLDRQTSSTPKSDLVCKRCVLVSLCFFFRADYRVAKYVTNPFPRTMMDFEIPRGWFSPSFLASFLAYVKMW